MNGFAFRLTVDSFQVNSFLRITSTYIAKMFFTAKIYLKHFFCSIYFTLYYFQELVDSAGLYYDRKRYIRLYEYLQQTDLCLYQYRAVYRKFPLPELSFPLNIANRPWHLHFLVKYFMVAFLFRSLAIAFVPSATDSELKKTASGTVLFGDASFYIETSTTFWSAICVFFLHYSIGSSLSSLDYRFLALFRMSEVAGQQQQKGSTEYAHFGLLSEDYRRFAGFRRYALLSYHCIILGLLIFAFLCIGGLYLQQGLYVSSPLWSALWTVIFSFWAVNMCTIIYGNLIAFIVVVKYLLIKQRSLVRRMAATLGALLKELNLPSSKHPQTKSIFSSGTWLRLQVLNLSYSHLFDELTQYNHFWRSYLSYIFVFYVMIIIFMLFIVFLSSIVLYIKIIYALALLVHIALLALVILFCGSVVAVNGHLAKRFYGNLARFPAFSSRISGNLTCFQRLKLHNAYAGAEYGGSGFRLLNGYLITFATFRLLIVDTALYFILFIRPVN